MLEYGWLAFEVLGVAALVIAISVLLNWIRLGMPMPPDDFK